jgi:hypothetical protein
MYTWTSSGTPRYQLPTDVDGCNYVPNEKSMADDSSTKLTYNIEVYS